MDDDGLWGWYGFCVCFLNCRRQVVVRMIWVVVGCGLWAVTMVVVVVGCGRFDFCFIYFFNRAGFFYYYFNVV